MEDLEISLAGVASEKERTRVTIAVVHPGSIGWEWHVSMINSLKDPRFQIRQAAAQSGVNINGARNTIMWQFLNQCNDPYLLWTDSDIAWTPDDIQTLIDSDKPIVSGLYYSVDEKAELFPVVTLDNTDPKHRASLDWINEVVDNGGIAQVEGCGMGFCLIKREVVEKLGVKDHLWPFAETEVKKKGKVVLYGEDTTFCQRARVMGFKTHVNVMARVGHKKSVHI
jgi:GT2 family glycosyltransferase